MPETAEQQHPRPRPALRRRPSVRHLAAAALLVAAGAALVAGVRGDGPGESASTVGTDGATRRGTGTPTPAAAALVVPDLPAEQRVAAPVRVQIPAIGVSTGLERLALASDGSLRTPRDPGRAGWFEGGPRPGEVGPAVVVGHLDSVSGPAVFWRLSRLRPGDRISVSAADGARHDFAVRRVRLVPQDGFPSDLVYAPTPAHALRLITCGGSYDHVQGHYRSNVVVFAEQV